MFARGGFDLQVGNPPWVRLDWEDDVTLAELDPAVGVAANLTGELLAAFRAKVLDQPSSAQSYSNAKAEHAGLTALSGARTCWPLLAGMRTNLYFLFMVATWRRARTDGAVALLHPESHLSDPKAATLRAEAYRRYREYFHFINELQLFREISHTRTYSVNVYSGDRGVVDFVQAAYLYHPLVVDRSIGHDGSGDLPGRKLASGEWDVRPHRDRLVHVDEDTLKAWAALLAYDEPAATPVVKSVTSAEAAAADAIARYPHRLGSAHYHWTVGFNEVGAVKKGLITERTEVPASLDEVILQGPHIGICTPYAKQPRPSGKHQQDYEAWDLANLPKHVVPRTNWQRKAGRAAFDAEIAQWDGRPHTARNRMIVRRQIASNTARSVFASLLPPGPTAVSVCYLGALGDDVSTVAFTASLGGLLADYFVRVTGATDLHDNVIARFPVPPSQSPLTARLTHRAARLNCLTADYADLWAALVAPGWAEDEFTDPVWAKRSIASPPREWDMSVPVRGELDRWLLLCELDALGALVLGVTPQGLEAVYRSQFPVLQAYEYQMLFDANGRQLCGDWHQHGFLQAQLEAEAKATKLPGWRKVWDRVQDYLAGDTSVDLGPFVPPLRRADRVASMTHAYWTFVDRYDLTPPEGAERPT